jgi:glycosyltransferase involved in cell wall biosynthesis
LFLHAAALVRAQLPEAHFLVVGDGPCRPSLTQLAGRLNLKKAVHFLGTRSDVPEVLSAMDVLLLTSHMEANPVSILEAMASEKPVVATRVGSVPETVRDGQTGYLVEPGDASALAQRTIELLSDPKHAQTLGRGGREETLQHWSIDRMVEGYEQLLTEIYERKLTSRPFLPSSGCRLPWCLPEEQLS